MPIQSNPIHILSHTGTQSGSRVQDTATKFSLVHASAPASAESVKSIADELRAACDELVAALGVLVDPAARAGASAPLMELYCQQVRSVLRALEELVRHAASACLLPSSSGASELAPKTGVVWAACEQLGKLPRSNKVAFRRAILQHQAAVRDTQREFRELLDEEEGHEEAQLEEEEEEEAEGAVTTGVDRVAAGVEGLNLGGNDEDYREDEDDLFGGLSAAPLKAWERTNVARCLVALGHSGDLMKAALAAVDEATAAACGEEQQEQQEQEQQQQQQQQQQERLMEAVGRIEESCQGLTAAVVNAADALYPPQVSEGGGGQSVRGLFSNGSTDVHPNHSLYQFTQVSQELESQLGALVEAAAAAAQAVAQLPSPGPAVAQCQGQAESVQEAAAVGVARGDMEEGKS